MLDALLKLYVIKMIQKSENVQVTATIDILVKMPRKGLG